MPGRTFSKRGGPLRRPDSRPYVRVPGEGCMDPGTVMLIGERPGDQEARAGRPFIGLAGQYMDMFMRSADLDRSQFYVTNLVKTFDDHKKPSPEEIKRDEDELYGEILTVQPRIVGLLGTYAVEALLDRDRAHMERTHGVPIHGLLAGFHECVVVPMYHPAAGMWSMDQMPMCADDFKKLAQVIDGSLHPPQDPLAGQEKYEQATGGVIVRRDAGVDTESAGFKEPWCLTYSVDPGSAWLHYPGQVQGLQFEGKVWLHNSLHDLGVLHRLGIHLRDNQFVDTMILAYLLGLEPQGLKDLAWRKAGMEMDSYESVLGVASYNRAMEYLMGVDASEWEPAEPYEIVVIDPKHHVEVRKVKRPHSINQRVRSILNDVDADKRSKKGVPVNPRARWDQIEDHVKQEVVETLGEMPEATLSDIPPEKARYYACRDSDATLRIARGLETQIIEMGLDRVAAIDHAIVPMIDRMQHTGIGLAPIEFWEAMEAKCDMEMAAAKKKIYDDTGWVINPDSPKQCRELLFDGLRIKPTKFTEKSTDENQIGSTKDKALEGMVSQCDTVAVVLDYREASKIKSSYVCVFERIVRRGHDRVHPNLRISRVVTGRPAATKPNVLAIPVRSELGKEIRGGFVASDGYLIMDDDLDQVEMRWMADESRDYRLVKLFLDGDKDVHTETAAGMFGVSVGNVKKEQRYAAKRVGFGVITGITEYGLLDQMVLARAVRPDGGAWTLDDCTQMIKEYFNLSPGVKMYMEQAGDEAETNECVRDRWGRIRWLPGARSPVPAVRAEARRQASSFKIQAGAQGLMKQGMAAVWEQVILPHATAWEDKWPIEPLLQIYDSLMLEVREDHAWVHDTVIWLLTNTVPTRTGLPITAKGGTGRTWLEA